MKLTSLVFKPQGVIPTVYTCDGSDISPPLTIEDVPEGTKSLTLILEDPDAPAGTWNHWIVFNIPSETQEIKEGIPPKGTLGAGTNGSVGYHGPCPPSGEHRYFFKIYALDTTLDLPKGVTKKHVLEAMAGHIIEEAELMGTYSRVAYA